VISTRIAQQELFNVKQDQAGFDVVTDASRAGGDSAQCPPAAGEQGEAAFSAAAGGPVGVVGLVVRGQGLSAAGLADRGADALGGAVVAAVGQGGQLELRGGPVQCREQLDRAGGEVVLVAGGDVGGSDREPIGAVCRPRWRCTSRA
jgi:hypothetical protein